MKSFLKAAERFEVQAYQRKRDWRLLKSACVPFTGSPRRHPYDPMRVILLAEPLSANPLYYEFQIDDIAMAEELPTMTTPEGETFAMARVWIRKLSIGVRSMPFLVSDADR